MILRHIIHDWSDAKAIQILRNCRWAISDQGKLLLVEFVSLGAHAYRQGMMMGQRSAGIRRHDDRRIVWQSSANTP
jgi:hypothetical protein